MSDDDLIRRGDALAFVRDPQAREDIAALPARGVGVSVAAMVRNHTRAEAAEAKVEKLRGALQIARVHVANNAEGWSVSRGAARDDLTIVDAALAPTDFVRCAECDCDDGNCTWIKMHIEPDAPTEDKT